MKSTFPDLVCTQCGSNRFKFPKSADGDVKCEDCGHPVASLKDLPARIVGNPRRKESKTDRLARHAAEVAKSHEELRASVAETDRLIVSSNEMLRRHREELDDNGK
jgi:uncharacterized Zn finger protein (UPF0148 family)